METRLQKWAVYFKDLWKRHSILIVLLMAALLFDTLTTIHFMTHHGINMELNPLVKYTAFLLGPVVGTILSAFVYKIITCVFLAMYLRPLRMWILVVPSVTATFAGFANLLSLCIVR